jgi:ABC-type uncharacterized transport system substrate-binding protein
MKLNKIIRGIGAILLAAAVLLLLDLNDETEKGIIDGLEEKGFIDKKTCNIKKFCPEGDMPTANTMAQNIVGSKFDIVITASTPALQVMANANKKGGVIHVFCTVTDPFVSGVGITGSAPNQHPKHLVGIGTFQPVERAFDIAKQMKPDLKKVGTVWCTSETCSEACVKLARTKCKELGIELVEMSVESTTQILETAMSLSARGVEALWLGGDNVVETGIDQLIKAATMAKIPLFTNNPYKIYGNTLFGVGAQYYDVGKIAGIMAADILNGKPTNEIGIINVVPNNLKVNPEALKNLKEKWDISAFE